ncbi:2-octaprenyl-6-methoxyphenyl hydroxylase [Vibrio sp. SCSIO 43136]|uniref:2-octaprenyl-6-methoxyphenyl hydroxylase n=1 Tax=Vibrio sp. SCSIO 43136 TaxID=2819101 RepID=UPI0020764895|nr:2-octaprenyl-6-methoxyphenyl hydroxylase [Vibrio sp. SCSIO 43136]USD65642.1 2-octaprenyl-6-methoxyphenyl hydroxylase [Vibrio sp. SCSIO 43136]
MKSYDVVIAGGAMAGATLAIALNQSRPELSIAVIEGFEPDPNQHPGFDSRAIALSYGSVEQLKRLKLWSGIAPQATAIERIHVSDRGHLGMAELDRSEIGAKALGYVVELANVGQFYHQQLKSLALDYYCPQQVAKVQQHSSHVDIALTDGQELQTKLLVAADGVDSVCCQQTGLGLEQLDFEQVAVIANICTDTVHNHQAFERFTNSGPLALLPMSDGRMSLVWCLRPDKAQQILAASDDEFLNQLQQAFGWRLGKLTHVGARASYPLLLKHRPQVTGHRIVAVGNAAQTLHPIAGQGFNLGLRDVLSLCEVLEQSENIGDYASLQAYRQRREQDRNYTMTMTSGLVSLFSNDALPLRVGRNLGLMMLDDSQLLKMPLMQRTMGLVDR